MTFDIVIILLTYDLSQKYDFSMVFSKNVSCNAVLTAVLNELCEGMAVSFVKLFLE